MEVEPALGYEGWLLEQRRNEKSFRGKEMAGTKACDWHRFHLQKLWKIGWGQTVKRDKYQAKKPHLSFIL